MNKKKFTKLLALYLPYVVIGLLATNLGEAWRLTTGKELGDKILSLMSTVLAAFANPLPSLHPFDLFVGLCCGAWMRLAVYLKGKNAKKYRHGMEYGSARWGTAKDIEPFTAPKFEDNIILTKTERLMMSNRPTDPKNARNKNVLIVGGSGSGKTRFWLKPNLLQCHSSYVVTDPKGSIVVECGNALLKKGYKLKIFNTINFSKSMHYNPMSYIHSEKDILKLVTALMTNTKGEGQGGDPFWDKAERLLLVSLIAYLHYEAPAEEQNFATLLEMLNTMQVSEDDETYQNPVDLLFEDTVTVTDEDSGALTPEGNLTLVDDYHTSYSDGSGQQFITLVSKSGNTFYLVIDRNSKGENTVHFMNLVDESDLLSLMDDEDAEAYTAEKEAAAQAELERKQAEEEAKKAEEAAASGAEQPKENKVTKYAATFLGVLALVGLAAGGGIYAFMKQKQKKQAEKEALDPDADYTEDKGDFEIPVEDDSDEDAAEDTPDE